MNDSPASALDIGACLNDAIEVYKRNWIVLAVCALLFDLLTTFTLGILAGPLIAGWCHLTLKAFAHPDRRAEVGDLFSAMHPFGRRVGLFFAYAFLTILSFLCLVIPVFITTTFFFYAFLLSYDRDLGVVDSLKKSFRVVQQRGFGPHLLLNVILLALTLAPLAMAPFSLLIGIFLLPLAILIETAAYIRVVRQDQGSLAGVLGPAS